MSDGILNFEKLDRKHNKIDKSLRLSSKERAQRRHSMDPMDDPVIQTSVRMRSSDFDRFRLLAKNLRRSNGELLQLLLDSFIDKEIAEQAAEPSKK